ncbi:MAG: endo-1,4-beta-xylanase xyn5A [Prevotella sp.]|nr:endo-1,4-beta-xylanase xyn5A [Candidatus Prevotella equi]
MKRFLLTLTMGIAALINTNAAPLTLKITTEEKQTITGFGAASLENLMRPTQDATIIRKAFNKTSVIGLNILRMEMSPNMEGDVNVGWDTPYDWKGQVTDVKAAIGCGAIVFATPWSPAAELKTNGSAQGGNDESKPESERVRATLKYPEKLFPWFNKFMDYMRSQGAPVKYVSFQNEPDWWVNYSGCLYSPEQMYNVIKDNIKSLDRSHGEKFIAGEPLGFNTDYFHRLLNDPEVNAQCDVLAGHVYGSYDCKKNIATLRSWAPDKEIWMTEHSVSSEYRHIPSWHEELDFAEDVNECLINGCNAYIYWYLCKDFGFIYDGTKYDQSACPGADNLKRGDILNRGRIMGQFARNLKGATLLKTSFSLPDGTKPATPGVNQRFETSVFKKGDSLIVNVIDTLPSSYEIKMVMPAKFVVKSLERIQSTEGNIYVKDNPVIEPELSEYTFAVPGRSFTTFIFKVEDADCAEGIEIDEQFNEPFSDEYFNISGQRINKPSQGMYIWNKKKYAQ